MASSFSRTLRSLRDDRPTAQLGLLAAAVALLGAWIAWAALARVTVVEATTVARIEVEQAAHPVQAPVAGRIVAIHMQLGAHVDVGDVLCELDGAASRLELARARARLLAIAPEIDALSKQLAAQSRASADDSVSVAATVAEAEARNDEASVGVKLAEEQLQRTKRLHAEGLVSDAELAKAEADVSQKRAVAAAQRAAIGRTGATGRAELSDRAAEAGRLTRELAVLEGEKLTSNALIDRLDHDVALRIVRASVAGRLAEVSPTTDGSVVAEGDRLGAIVPDGTLRIVGEFPPARALGRIRPGQLAQMRLDGFPWAQHGTLPARVSRLASEVRDGRLRVELEVLPNDSDVPLQHGLPGSVEVEVERTSPLVLLLRAAGKVIDGSTAGDAGDGPTPGPSAAHP